MFCCDETYFLTCAGHCGTVALSGLVSDASGFHTLEFFWHTAKVEKLFEVDTIGETLSFSNPFNEVSAQTFKIKKPNGDYYTHDVSGTTYECFSVRSYIAVGAYFEDAASDSDVLNAICNAQKTYEFSVNSGNSVVLPVSPVCVVDVHLNGVYVPPSQWTFNGNTTVTYDARNFSAQGESFVVTVIEQT